MRGRETQEIERESKGGRDDEKKVENVERKRIR